MDEPKAKYLVFEPGLAKPKTKTWRVLNVDLIGVISWYGPWRQYAFSPLEGTVFEKTCLRDIANFCEYHTNAHRLLRKAL